MFNGKGGSYDKGVGPDDVMRTLSRFAEAGRGSLDWAALWRVIAEHRLEQVRRREDHRVVDAWIGRGNNRDPLESPVPDAEALAIKVNGLALGGVVRFGEAWERLVVAYAPRFRDALEAYQAYDDPSAEARLAVVNLMRVMSLELGDLIRDQAALVESDLRRIEREILPFEEVRGPDWDFAPLRHGAKLRRIQRWKDLTKKNRNRTTNRRKPEPLPAMIEALNTRILAWIEGADPAVKPMLQHQFQGHIKYFRSLTIFACHAAAHGKEQPVPDRLLISAQVVEMIHNVTLIIDDIVDQSDERREKATQHALYDGLTAYMVAGYLVADVYDLLARTIPDEWRDLVGIEREAVFGHRPTTAVDRGGMDNPAGASISEMSDLHRQIPAAYLDDLNCCGPARFEMRLISELIKRLAVAECVQWDNRKAGTVRRDQRMPVPPLGVADWRYLAREDTGCMFEICAVLGSGSQRFRRFGRLLGMLYHGCDDVSDVEGISALGGGGGADVRDGILTLPAALALEKHGESLRKIFAKPDEKLSTADRNRITAALNEECGAARKVLDEIARQAQEEVHALGLPDPEVLLRLIQDVRKLAG